ncbi:MAG: FHA domain-containing protein [Fimbriiglobus sp.]
MSDPRLDETHLDSPRREHYIEAREDVFDSMGPTTGKIEEEFHFGRWPVGFVPSPARLALRDLSSGRLYMLRVGINTLGRHPQNDIVLEQSSVSRRHCVIVVHASGQVELRDTASRNGVRFRHESVAVVELVAGDILRICDYKLMLLAEVADTGETSENAGQETGEYGARTKS